MECSNEVSMCLNVQDKAILLIENLKDSNYQRKMSKMEREVE